MCVCVCVCVCVCSPFSGYPLGRACVRVFVCLLRSLLATVTTVATPSGIHLMYLQHSMKEKKT